jgi:hypothetical protein
VVIQVDKRAVLKAKLIEAAVVLTGTAFALVTNIMGIDIGADIVLGALATVAMLTVITTWADLHEDGLE